MAPSVTPCATRQGSAGAVTGAGVAGAGTAAKTLAELGADLGDAWLDACVTAAAQPAAMPQHITPTPKLIATNRPDTPMGRKVSRKVRKIKPQSSQQTSSQSVNATLHGALEP